ncbi:gamma-glutamyl-gamma-aminobutyrate hydrolase family protein [Nonomuraea roseoviolacea]|uniref:Gamma-glutamyl-gamma-aminobutyrate hydrolase PuuD n=1 Tax=Nonomuraea roseoviolacea subsp. carminata TaxID=160689 RepID=A0ABT1JU80_9ACTN|nr:gamma-glutamyl-gamma-aminobutyrate hydrolase family protein [Nonomuraea roseoviolacea]MCP2345311.1 gamma-glutamyl-gamma-aminobutyrate hydrolase PuuD [Nonomuraea roseoviolacea subsp. carminata]
MSRPVIGITTYVEPARYTVWELDAALLPFMYVEQVVRAGGQPVLLPPAGEPGPVAARLDGLILAGGGDIDPARYREEPHERVSYVRGFRDDAEFALLAAALEREVPYLGVCRGLQVLNVALGGSLHQHLPDVVGHTEHSPGPGEFGHLPVRPVPGSRLAKALGTEPVEVPHYHHQAVDRLGLGLSVTATAADGTVEAVELDGHPFAVAVQWHPEAAADCALFEALVAAC